jgi:hypothetical protein
MNSRVNTMYNSIRFIRIGYKEYSQWHKKKGIPLVITVVGKFLNKNGRAK